VVKVIAGIAAVVFLLARFTTTKGVLLFAGSVVVLLVCFGLLKLLEDDDENTGFWPRDPKQRFLDSYDFPVLIVVIGKQVVTSIFDGRSAETRVLG
jgi:hypothetical protein